MASVKYTFLEAEATDTLIHLYLKRIRRQKERSANKYGPKLKKVAGKKTERRQDKFLPFVRKTLTTMMISSPKKLNIRGRIKPYPTEIEKRETSKKLGLTIVQINNFASNYRRRMKVFGNIKF